MNGSITLLMTDGDKTDDGFKTTYTYYALQITDTQILLSSVYYNLHEPFPGNGL
jgi:hypothetical protein